VVSARPELRGTWSLIKDLLIDDPSLAKKIIEQDLAEDQWGEKKRDFLRAIEAVRALRGEVTKSKMSLGAEFARIDEGLSKLEDQIAQLGREMAVTAKLALVYREEGKPEQANKFYERLIAYDPTNPEFLAATVELVIKQLKDGVPVPAAAVEATRIKAARVRDASPDGSPTKWTAKIQVLELSLWMKDVDMVNKSLRFDGVNQSTPADDLQMIPRNPRDDKRVRRARNALAVELCQRYLDIFTKPGVNAKPTFAISEVEIDGKATPVFVPVGSPRFMAVRRDLENGSTVIFLWEDGQTPPPEPETSQAPTTQRLSLIHI
jgi:tetratricopeptide (TPR) repeat protein